MLRLLINKYKKAPQAANLEQVQNTVQKLFMRIQNSEI